MSTPGVRTHYQVLGVSPGAGTDEIRRAHRQLARVLHPDRQAGATDAERRLAERRMREVNAAWTVLSDPQRRKEYDFSLRAERTGPRAGAGSRAGAAARPGPGSSRQPWSETTRPEDAADPDAAFARAREDELDPDEEELSEMHFWVLRRGPIIAAVLVALFLFVVTAYAGSGAVGNGDADTGQPTTTVAEPAECARLVDGRNAVAVPCSEANDGRIMTEVDEALACPSKTKYVLIGSRFFCVSSDPSVASSTPPGLGD